MVNDAVLSVRRLEKVYPNGTAALKSASFDIAGATIHGLIGANGAGKSTLIKILSGAIPASAGEIVWLDERRGWRRPADAAAAGIATIHQQAARQTAPITPIPIANDRLMKLILPACRSFSRTLRIDALNPGNHPAVTVPV